MQAFGAGFLVAGVVVSIFSMYASHNILSLRRNFLLYLTYVLLIHYIKDTTETFQCDHTPQMFFLQVTVKNLALSVKHFIHSDGQLFGPTGSLSRTQNRLRGAKRLII